jgi:protein SCO1/2
MRSCSDAPLLALALLCGAAQAAGAQTGVTQTTAGREQDAIRTSQAAIGREVGGWLLTDHRGRPLRLDQLRDKPLVVSLVYTGCFQVCPATTQFLKKAVAQARDALGPDRFRVVSIGFNQPFDTPEALAQFARQQGVADDAWFFAAPRTADVEPLLAQFGMTVTPSAAGFDHVIQASIVDTRGVIVRQVYGDAFELPMFIDPLKSILSGDAAREVSLENIWTKVKLYCTVYDPASGKYKLDYSLFVELFAGLSTLGAGLWFMWREWRRARRARPA